MALWLTNVVVGSAMDDAILAFAGADGVALEGLPCVTIDTSGSFDAYLASRSRNMRTLRSKRLRRLAEEGLRTERVPFDAAACEQLLELQALRARQAGLAAFREKPQGDLLRRCAGRGGLELARLVGASGEVAAAMLLVTGSGAVGIYMQGFDPRFARFSPSYCLLWRVIEEAFAGDTAVVDLMRGDEPYKARFATGVTPQRRWVIGITGPPPPDLVRYVDATEE